MTCSACFPMLCTKWGWSGAAHNAEPTAGADDMDRESKRTFPSASYRMKSLQLRMYRTAGHWCVWTGVRSPGPSRVSRTRTCAFSSSTSWWPRATRMASSGCKAWSDMAPPCSPWLGKRSPWGRSMATFVFAQLPKLGEPVTYALSLGWVWVAFARLRGR